MDRTGSNATLNWFGSIDSEHSVDDESTWLLNGLVLSPRRRVVRKVVKGFWTRNIVLNVIPPALTLVWASIPFPTFGATNLLLIRTVLPSDNPDIELNFWFFLFVYYGFYNAVGLLWVTKLFNLYSLNWWPKSLGPSISNLAFWSFSVLLGCGIYLFSGLERYSLTWVCLSSVTMTGPILVAFGKMRHDHRHSIRPPLTETQRTFLLQPILHIPASYIRFLWFCVVLLIALGAFVLGEAYAYIYLASLPHKNPVDALIYVYSWVVTIHLLDWLSGWMLGSQIGSYPLGLVFKFYYRIIYMVFVRNLYARLHSPEQYAYLSAGSSVGALIIWPISMTRFAHSVYRSITRSDISYDEYKKNSGRNIYLETLVSGTPTQKEGWLTRLGQEHYDDCVFGMGDNTALWHEQESVSVLFVQRADEGHG
ncbi:hypothetical protein NEOLI_005065 [Neolecta irregularis DAH-3]|uniref:Uncharacterized protein n=1 Tax=Neolecta irregularis (strain DAH-3) TaxID=1198029 RepID=A0A1U7LRC6_NEOID|nr:hypothetical protein NEOLI_005065 [Neolecta irregularis DAH-3]|eukprot:OLL25102.1 hypothetical protein NEOLI_005065 [Neolecta irregularis DAH-3]